MTSHALLQPVPMAVAALEHAFSEHGASRLDPRVPDTVWWRALVGPANEFLSRPGKQLRTLIVRAGCQLVGGPAAGLADPLGTIIELLHAGSLVIDDVEDGADKRRGAPALHHVFGVPLAINTGSWLYFWALAEIGALGLSPAAEAAVYRAACTTLVRCHQGQALDLATKIHEIAPADVPAVVDATTRLKTGELCAFATSAAAIASGASDAVCTATRRLGTSIGTALQMLDDLGSLTAPARRPKAHEDLREARPTWPWAWLAETKPFAWSRLAARARTAHTDAEHDEVADALASEIENVGRERIRMLIDDTLAELVAALGSNGNTPALAMVGAALTHMEKSYG